MPLYPNYVPNSTMNPNTNIYTSTPNYYWRIETWPMII